MVVLGGERLLIMQKKMKATILHSRPALVSGMPRKLACSFYSSACLESWCPICARQKLKTSCAWDMGIRFFVFALPSNDPAAKNDSTCDLKSPRLILPCIYQIDSLSACYHPARYCRCSWLFFGLPQACANC